jgi:hypothetical protein
MARVAMVTRTITTTKVVVLCLELTKVEPFNMEIVLAGAFKDQKTIMKAVETKVNNDTQKAVQLIKAEEVETLYGMTEAEFIEKANKLPARGTKEETANTAETVTNEEPADTKKTK